LGPNGFYGSNLKLGYSTDQFTNEITDQILSLLKKPKDFQKLSQKQEKG
jgi:hypothetical protein